MKIKAPVFLLLLFIVCTACNSAKKIRKTKAKITGKEDILRCINEPDTTIANIRVRFHVSFISESVKREFTMHVKIIRDSMIYASITAILGIELYRILIDKDSFIMLDRLNKQSMKGNNDVLGKLLPVQGLNYRSLENMIMGKSFFTVEKDFKFEKENNLVLFQKEDIIASRYVYFDLNDKMVKECTYHDISNTKMTIRYKGEISDRGFVFPLEIILSIMPVNMKLLLQYQTLKINQDLDIKFRVPDNYEIVDL
jgi:hypothetical protein